MALADNLLTRLEAIGVELATIQSTPIAHKSDAGASRKGTLQSYRLQLYEEMAKIIKTLTDLGYTVDEDGLVVTNDPYEVNTYAV